MQKIKLGEVGEIITGRTPSTSIKNYWGNDFIFVTPLELYQPFHINSSEKMISNDGMNAINLNRVGNISVLVGCIGAEIGNVGIVNKKCAFNQQINAITNFNENFNPYFIYYLLSGKKELFRKMAGRTTLPILKKSDFENLEIEVPPLAEQKKIGAFLYSLDEKISVNKKINSTLEEMAWIIYLHKFFRNAGNGKLGDVIIENPKSTISVGDAKNSGGDFPFFTSGENILHWKEKLVDGRNIFVNTGGNAGINFYVGAAAYSTDTWSITAENLADYLYLFLHCIKVEIGKKFFKGTALKHLQKDLLREREIYIPSDAELEEFNRAVAPSFDMISKNLRENYRLAEMRNFLLPLLMNGQVSFKED